MSRSLPDMSVIVSLIPRLSQMSTHLQSLGDEATHSFEKQIQFTLELRKTDYPNWLVREYRHEYPCCHCSTMLCVSYRVDVRRFHTLDIFCYHEWQKNGCFCCILQKKKSCADNMLFNSNCELYTKLYQLSADGIVWEAWTGDTYSLKTAIRSK